MTQPEALEPPDEQRQILVLRALRLGDLLTAVPALRALRRARPEHVLTLAGPEWLAPVVPLIGAVDRLEPCDDLRAELPVSEPELAVNLHGRGPESLRLLLSTWPDSLLTFAHDDLPGFRGPQWDADEHEVRRWCRLVEWGGMPADPTDLRLAVPNRRPVRPGSVVVHPGAASASRRWPAERFAAVARALSQAGCPVVVTGSAGEADLVREVAKRADLDPTAEIVGLALDELAALIAAAELVICGDTGLAHLASAFGTRSVLIFGPTPPSRWGPPAGPHTVLWAGRIGDPHGDLPDPGLLEIEVGEVLAAAGI